MTVAKVVTVKTHGLHKNCDALGEISFQRVTNFMQHIHLSHRQRFEGGAVQSLRGMTADRRG